MENSTQSKAPLIISIVVLVLVVAGAIWYLTSDKGPKSGIPTQEMVYPKPAEVLHSLSGTVDKVYGATIFFNVVDPNDYTPHADGTPRTMQLRAASLLPETELSYTNSITNITRAFKVTELKTGDNITVESAGNIKDATKFDVTKVYLIR